MGSMSGFGKSGPQKREYDRVAFLKKITVRTLSNNRFIPANSIDINIKGLRFFSKSTFAPNERIAIQVWVDNVSASDPLWIAARVVWSKIEQDGAITGVQFDDLIRSDRHPRLYRMIFTNQY